MDIVFLLSHIPDPRMNKRIAIAKIAGETSLICWDKQATHIWDLQHEDIENYVIRINASGTEPLKRVVQTVRFAAAALKQLKKMQPKCIYAGNIDMLCVAYLYSLGRKTNLIYEVADLNKLIVDEPRSLIVKILRKLLIFTERRLCGKTKALVLTSEKYFQYYYSKFIPEEKVLVIPNMPDLTAFENYQVKKSGAFTIGFIGGIRYINQMKMLVDAAEKCPIEVLIAGTGFSQKEELEIRKYCEAKSFVKFTGKYDFMTEAAELYGRCDCIYSVYDADLNNVKVALPNKLYEAIYCGLPIIVAKDTYLAELVENMGVGVAVSHTDETELEQVLKRLSEDKVYYSTFVQACFAHKGEINIDSYNKRLIDKIKTLV